MEKKISRNISGLRGFNTGFGPHLMIDGYGCDPKKAGNEKFVHEVLEEFPQRIGMTKISGPHMIDYNGGDKPEDSGVSGFVIIAESHISIHTFPKKGFISIDIFSCKHFDIDKSVEFVKEKFGVQRVEMNLLTRGMEYPKLAAKAMPYVNRERKKIIMR